MDKKRSDFFQNSLTAVLPLILSVVLSSALYSVYSINLFSVWTLGIILVTAVMFLFCRFIDKHHFIGGAIFVVVLMFALYWFMVLIAGNDYGQTFQQWFLTGADKVQTKTSYLLALMVSFVPFFAVTVYYFSMILYRMSFLTLISLIPCAVYVKVLSDIDNVYVALIALLNVAILMSSVRQKRENGRMVVGKGASMMSAAVFTFVLLIISAAIPKEENARYYDRLKSCSWIPPTITGSFPIIPISASFLAAQIRSEASPTDVCTRFTALRTHISSARPLITMILRMTAGMRTTVIPSRIILIMSGRLRRESFPLLSFRKP